MGVWEKVFVAFFLIHIPITILFDIQGTLVPSSVYPEQLQQTTAWYVREFEDFLMGAPPLWFRSFIFFELFFQLPLLLSSLYGLLTSTCYFHFIVDGHGCNVVGEQTVLGVG